MRDLPLVQYDSYRAILAVTAVQRCRSLYLSSAQKIIQSSSRGFDGNIGLLGKLTSAFLATAIPDTFDELIAYLIYIEMFRR